MRTLTTHNGAVGSNERTTDIPVNPKSMSAASSLAAMRLGAASQGDPLAGRALTGVAADLALANAAALPASKLPEFDKEVRASVQKFSRGDSAYHVGKKVKVVVLQINASEAVVADSAGNKWKANVKNLRVL